MLDSSHAHSRGVLDAADQVRERFPDVQLVIGNVATAEGTEALIERGADGVKVGIGPGSICTTRVVTGAGVPQVTAIRDCARAAAEHGVPVIADGGIKFSGDVSKALASGAHCVMIGSLFAGTEESPGETILYQGRQFKAYRGMGSLGAMARGSADRYFQEAPPGEEPASVETTVWRCRSWCRRASRAWCRTRAASTRCCPSSPAACAPAWVWPGCKDVDELRTRAKVVRVTAAGLKESHAHDVVITKEAPNYWVER